MSFRVDLDGDFLEGAPTNHVFCICFVIQCSNVAAPALFNCEPKLDALKLIFINWGTELRMVLFAKLVAIFMFMQNQLKSLEPMMNIRIC